MIVSTRLIRFRPFSTSRCALRSRLLAAKLWCERLRVRGVRSASGVPSTYGWRVNSIDRWRRGCEPTSSTDAHVTGRRGITLRSCPTNERARSAVGQRTRTKCSLVEAPALPFPPERRQVDTEELGRLFERAGVSQHSFDVRALDILQRRQRRDGRLPSVPDLCTTAMSLTIEVISFSPLCAVRTISGVVRTSVLGSGERRDQEQNRRDGDPSQQDHGQHVLGDAAPALERLAMPVSLLHARRRGEVWCETQLARSNANAAPPRDGALLQLRMDSRSRNSRDTEQKGPSLRGSTREFLPSRLREKGFGTPLCEDRSVKSLDFLEVEPLGSPHSGSFSATC